MTLNCVVFNKNQIYRPLSFIYKLSSDYGLLSKTKFNFRGLVSQYQAVYFNFFEKLHNLKS
jgi:hypothetical protein